MSYWNKKEDVKEVETRAMIAEKEKYLRAMQQAAYDREYDSPFTSMFGGGALSQTFTQATQPQEDKPKHVGQLLWKGAPLPADWRGAQYDTCTRTLVGEKYPHWQLDFGSKWASERIRVRLDAEKVTGEEAHRMSQTFMEAINQRRAG